jgi:hypothetical protein
MEAFGLAQLELFIEKKKDNFQFLVAKENSEPC